MSENGENCGHLGKLMFFGAGNLPILVFKSGNPSEKIAMAPKTIPPPPHHSENGWDLQVKWMQISGKKSNLAMIFRGKSSN